ncbi:hypothetical protein [Puia sp.]|jgi:antitoxin component YwqK of YwqJK toxin-antitoxin module|uniref:hypothetical protein n=1 Tax=Puia sp. TaxID=2045100 RepID=UPI002F4017DB
MTKLFIILACALSLTQATDAQENNPLIVSGDILQQADKLYDSGQYKKAIVIYRKIDKNDTNYVKGLFGIGASYLEDTQFNAALEYTKKALALGSDPEMEPRLYNQYGNIYNEWDSSEHAIRIYDSAIRIYPAFSLFYLNKGSALIKLERFAEAEAVFKQCLLINPYSYSGHYKLGYCAIKQGKVIPAFLSFIGYLTLDPEGSFHSSCIQWMNNIARNLDSVQAVVSRRKEEPGESYQLLEQIVQSGIALNKGYVPLPKLDDPISRQIQVLFEKMEYREDDNDFWMQYYIPWFKSVYTGNRFEVLVNRIFLDVKVPIIQDYIKKHKKDLDDLTSDLVDYLNRIITTRELNYAKRQTDTMMWSRSNGNLTGYGAYDRKEEKREGPWTLYYGPGNLKGKGSYNTTGGREGNFTWYYYNGSPRGKEFYRNGKQEGEETYYFANGVPSSHSWYKNDSLDGESATFYYVGTPRTFTRYNNGSPEGTKIYFRNNGDTNLIERYKAGKLDGITRSLSKYGTTEALTGYKNGDAEGTYQKFYPGGQLLCQGEYKAGKQEGIWKWWHPNGRLKLVTSFVNDQNDGTREEYYDNGAVSSTYSVKAGKMIGDAKYFDEDAKLYALLHYDSKSLQKAQYYDKAGKLIGESIRDNSKKAIRLTQYSPDGSKRWEATYNDNDDITDTLITYYKSGKIFGTDAYAGGRQEGLSATFYPDGIKRTETMYSAGKMDGYHRSYFRHGQLQEQGWYRQGSSEGYWIDFNEMGDITDSSYYLDDDLDGYKTSYAPDGRKTFELKFKTGWLTEYTLYDTTGKVLSRFSSPTGTGKLRMTYANGQARIEGEYQRSKLAGPYRQWYFDGKPSELAHYTRGLQDSSYKSWYHSGIPAAEGQYAFGEKTGLWKYYYANGTLRETESFVRGDLDGIQTDYFENGKIETVTPFKDGQKEGVAKEYDPDGTLIYAMTYLHGDPVAYSYLDSKDSLVPAIPIPFESGKIRTYFPNGKPSAAFEYREGVFDGERSFYYTNGQLRSVIHWKNGAAEGANIVYHSNGKIKISSNYVHDDLQGPYRVYNDKGIVREEWNYYCDVPNGETRLFDDDGRLLETDHYYFGTLLSAKK